MSEIRASPAELFRAMAERIDRNTAEEFAGAILIVPPVGADGEIDATEVLLINPDPNEAYFWHVVKVHYELGQGRWAERETTPSPGGFRR